MPTNDEIRHRWTAVAYALCGVCMLPRWIYTLGARSNGDTGRPRQTSVNVCEACLLEAIQAIGDGTVAAAKRKES